MNIYKKLSTWVVAGLIIIAALSFWAYKVGVFSRSTGTQQASTISYQGQAGKNALELLKAKYQVDTKSFSSGEMVTGVNGVKADDKHFWDFYVNGKEATVGAGQYVTKDGDVIEWKLKEINTKL